MIAVTMVLTLSSCGKNGAIDVETPTRDVTSISTNVEKMVADGKYCCLTLDIPDTWNCVVNHTPRNEGFGIRYSGLDISPKGADRGQIEVHYFDNFVVCGTDLMSARITLAGGSAAVNKYKGGDDGWDFISFHCEGKGSVIAWASSCGSWTNEMWEEAMVILNTLSIKMK